MSDSGPSTAPSPAGARTPPPGVCSTGCASVPPPPVSVYHSTGAWAAAEAGRTEATSSSAARAGRRNEVIADRVSPGWPGLLVRASGHAGYAPPALSGPRPQVRPPPARVGRGGDRHRHAAPPAPAQAAAAGGFRALLAGARRARARRAPLAPARCGHLDAPDVGLLRSLRHAGRRPRCAAAAPQGRVPDPFRHGARPRHGPHHQAPARARSRGPGGAARVRPLGDPLELVPRAARDARLHPAAPPRALPALGRPDGRLLRHRVRHLLAGPDRAAVVGRSQRRGCPRYGASWPRRASASGDVCGTRFTIHCKATRSQQCPHSISVPQ